MRFVYFIHGLLAIIRIGKMNKYVQNVRKLPFKPFHVLTVFHLRSTMRTAHLNIEHKSAITASNVQHTYIHTVSALGPIPAISK